MDTQAYLLRVLETGEYLKVGSSAVKKTDVRVVTATNVDLEKKISNGKFREDLYYRLNTVPISIPSLHERRGDIHLLFRKFANDFAEKYKTDTIRLDDEAKQLIENYRWPGNIRELRNLVEQLSVLSEDNLISATDLLKTAPRIANRNLPAKHSSSGKTDFEEREILYKFLFDMKSDLNDLKNMFYEMVQRNDLEMPSSKSSMPGRYNEEFDRLPHAKDFNYNDRKNDGSYNDYDEDTVIINKQDAYSEAEEVEESLSLDQKTKELITKALKKHSGKRKHAAEDLGISERTLYRKIKEYEIDI